MLINWQNKYRLIEKFMTMLRVVMQQISANPDIVVIEHAGITPMVLKILSRNARNNEGFKIAITVHPKNPSPLEVTLFNVEEGVPLLHFPSARNMKQCMNALFCCAHLLRTPLRICKRNLELIKRSLRQEIPKPQSNAEVAAVPCCSESSDLPVLANRLARKLAGLEEEMQWEEDPVKNEVTTAAEFIAAVQQLFPLACEEYGAGRVSQQRSSTDECVLSIELAHMRLLFRFRYVTGGNWECAA